MPQAQEKRQKRGSKKEHFFQTNKYFWPFCLYLRNALPPNKHKRTFQAAEADPRDKLSASTAPSSVRQCCPLPTRWWLGQFSEQPAATGPELRALSLRFIAQALRHRGDGGGQICGCRGSTRFTMTDGALISVIDSPNGKPQKLGRPEQALGSPNNSIVTRQTNSNFQSGNFP